ncbi:MAG: class I SAM-dependent methyltransferase [Methylotenera sp.]|nr:class I SAM-dependent methyltransferase [Oligoflexia bacterium]
MLKLSTKETGSAPLEIRSGRLVCEKCNAEFPILAGVAVLVHDVRNYLISHVKGVMQAVPEAELPRDHLRDLLTARSELQVEHIEEDLESARVTALYLMNHYLRVEKTETTSGSSSFERWWSPRTGEGSPLIDSLVREHWDRGPFAQIKTWVREIAGRTGSRQSVVELGCGVGGLYGELKTELSSYLGVDSSFASIALGRHLALGVPYSGKILIPEDLLQGPVTRELTGLAATSLDGTADFVVGDLEAPPVEAGQSDLVLALNAIDMLEDPSVLPQIQNLLLRKGGTAIQSCPYIWHEAVASQLRKILPREIRDSAAAAEWLSEKAGLKVMKRVNHLPWLFFKHVRQLEIYSVHLFAATKT